MTRSRNQAERNGERSHAAFKADGPKPSRNGSKFHTDWRGISVERIFAAAGLEEPPSSFMMAFCDGGYTTNLPLEDLLEGKALVVWEFEASRSRPSTGGRARLLVLHLYFCESAKWVRGLRFMEGNEPGVLGGERVPQLR